MKIVADISEYQGVVFYNQLSSKVDQVILRAGYTGYGSARSQNYDANFDSYYKGLKGKVPLGIYYFTLAHSLELAEKEAVWIINCVNSYPIETKVWIDVEAQTNCKEWTNLSVADRTKYVLHILTKLKNAGIPCGVYASTSWLNNKLDMSALSGFKVWVAQYTSASSHSYKGGNVEMWQYSSKGNGNAYGVGSYYIDLSHWYDDAEESEVEDTMVYFKVKKGTYKTNGKWAIPTRANASSNYDLNYPVYVGEVFAVKGEPLNCNGVPAYEIGYGSQKGRVMKFDPNDLTDGYYTMVTNG